MPTAVKQITKTSLIQFQNGKGEKGAEMVASKGTGVSSRASRPGLHKETPCAGTTARQMPGGPGLKLENPMVDTALHYV